MTTEPRFQPAMLQLIIAMILSGSIGYFVVESQQPAIVVVFYRCLIGALALTIYGLATNTLSIDRLPASTLAWIALSGLTMTANWVLFFQAYSHASISTVTVVYHVYPFVLIFAAALLFKEKLQLRSLGWALVAFAGVYCIVDAPDQTDGMSPVGVGLTLAAMAFYAGTLLIAKRLAKVPPATTTTLQLVVGTLVLAPFAGGSGSDLTADAWGHLLILGTVHTALLYVLLYGAVQRLRTAVVAILSFLYPATALAFDVVVYDVRPGLVQTLGMAAVLLAVVGERLQWSVLKRKTPAPAE